MFHNIMAIELKIGGEPRVLLAASVADVDAAYEKLCFVRMNGGSSR